MNSSKIYRFTLTQKKKVLKYRLYCCETDSDKGLAGSKSEKAHEEEV